MNSDLVVRIEAFGFWVSKTGRLSMNVSGIVLRPQISCNYTFQIGPKKQRLDFKNAFIWDGSDPREVALAVKQALVDYVRITEYMPEGYRQCFVDLVLNHHKQDSK